MPKTTADEWFEDYLRERGGEPGDHEPDPWGLGDSRPDYLPTAEGEQIACEVKQFGKDSKLERRLADQSVGVTPDTELYGPIRNQVKEAAKQLKPLVAREIPLVVVMANPEGVWVDLSVQNVIAASTEILSGRCRLIRPPAPPSMMGARAGPRRQADE